MLLTFSQSPFSALPASLHPPEATAAVCRNFSCGRGGITSLAAPFGCQTRHSAASARPAALQRHGNGEETRGRREGALRKGGDSLTGRKRGRREREKESEGEGAAVAALFPPLSKKDASRPVRDDALPLRTAAGHPVSDRVLDPRTHRSLTCDPTSKLCVRACVQGASLSLCLSSPWSTHRRIGKDAEPTDEQQRQESGPGMQLHREAAGRLRVHLHDPGQWRPVFACCLFTLLLWRTR